MYKRISLFSRKFTFSHNSDVLGSKFFSTSESISPILQDEKKLVEHAVHNTCFAKSFHCNLLILCPRTISKSMFIGNLLDFGTMSGSVRFFAPFRANFTHASALRLEFFTLLIVCATLRLETYAFIVVLFRCFLVAAHVTKARAWSGLIGKLNLMPKFLQKSSYKCQAEQCLAQVCLVAEYKTNLLKSSHRLWNSGANSSLDFNILLIVVLQCDENLAARFVSGSVS